MKRKSVWSAVAMMAVLCVMCVSLCACVSTDPEDGKPKEMSFDDFMTKVVVATNYTIEQSMSVEMAETSTTSTGTMARQGDTVYAKMHGVSADVPNYFESYVTKSESMYYAAERMDEKAAFECRSSDVPIETILNGVPPFEELTESMFTKEGNIYTLNLKAELPDIFAALPEDTVFKIDLSNAETPKIEISATEVSGPASTIMVTKMSATYSKIASTIIELPKVLTDFIQASTAAPTTKG